MTSETAKPSTLALLVITFLALLLILFRVGSQPVSDDDYLVAISAINYMESGQLGPTMWNHPCLRNILVYWTLWAFGTGVAGVKGISILLGTLCTPLIGAVSGRMFRDGRIALIAALLWACDPLVIDFSRQGINDIYLAFFPLLGIYLAYRYRETGNQWWLIFSGVGFGLGLASKWSGLFPLAITFILLARTIHRDRSENFRLRMARYIHVSVLLLVVPVLVYLLTFIPWFSRGYSLSEWPELQRSMFLETSQHAGYRPKLWDDRDNRAYKWFIMPSVYVDPFMNMDRVDMNGPVRPSLDDSITVVLGYSNPLVWLLTLPAVFMLGVRGARSRDEGLLYPAALFLASYLPLVLTSRPIWMNTALSVVPYAVMAVAYFVCSIADRSGFRRLVLGSYLVLVLTVAAPLYLLAIGKGMEIPVLKRYFIDKYLVQVRHSMSAGSGAEDGGAKPLPVPAQHNLP